MYPAGQQLNTVTFYYCQLLLPSPGLRQAPVERCPNISLGVNSHGKNITTPKTSISKYLNFYLDSILKFTCQRKQFSIFTNKLFQATFQESIKPQQNKISMFSSPIQRLITLLCNARRKFPREITMAMGCTATTNRKICSHCSENTQLTKCEHQFNSGTNLKPELYRTNSLSSIQPD